MFENRMLEKSLQSEDALDRFESELHLLEVETFEIEEVVDLGQSAPLRDAGGGSSSCTTSCCSCSSSSS
jgi:thiazolylpeptide-type bacteriocin precursor